MRGVSLAARAFRGAAFSVGTGIGARAIGLCATLLLTRHMAPAAFGEVAAAAVVATTLNQATTLGVGMYLVTAREADGSDVYFASLLNLGLALLAFGAALLCGGPLGPLLGAPGLHAALPGIALALLLERVSYVPERLLLREMRFGAVGLLRVLGEAAYAGVALCCAAAGWGGAAIVAGGLGRAGLRAAVLLAACPPWRWLRPAPLRPGQLRRIGGSGLLVSLAGLADMATRKWDNLLVSRFFGPAVLGGYNLAYNLAEIPALQVSEQITDVLVVSLSRAEPAARVPGLLRALGLLALVLFPLCVGLGAVAPTVTALLFPGAWGGVGPLLAALAPLSLVRPIDGAIVAYLNAQGRPGVITRLDWLCLLLLLGLLLLIGRHSPLAACVAVGLTFAARALLYMDVLRRLDGVPLRRQLAPLGGPALCTAPMAAAVLLVQRGLRLPPAASLPLEILCGALVYVAAALLLCRPAARDLLSLLRRRR